MSDNSPGTIHLPARAIPVPVTISAEAQAFLASPMFGAEPDVPALGDLAGWREHCAKSNAGLTMFMKMRSAGYDTTHAVLRPGDFDLYDITPANHSDPAHAVLYIHGGAFIVGGGEAALYAAQQIAVLSGLRTFSVDYRMPPDHPFPAGLDDCVASYRLMLESVAPEKIAVYGGSAGANLAVTTILKARDLGLPLPGACVLHSPVSDLRQVGDTFTTNAEIDVVLKRAGEWLPALYSGGHDLMDPLLSPVFADYTKGFPPTVLTSGTRDLLLSDTVRLHRALRGAGIRAELHVWEAMCHGLAHDAPEARELLGEHVAFLRGALGLT